MQRLFDWSVMALLTVILAYMAVATFGTPITQQMVMAWVAMASLFGVAVVLFVRRFHG